MTTGRKVSTLTSHHNIKIKTTYYSFNLDYQDPRLLYEHSYITVSCKKIQLQKVIHLHISDVYILYLVLPTPMEDILCTSEIKKFYVKCSPQN